MNQEKLHRFRWACTFKETEFTVDLVVEILRSKDFREIMKSSARGTLRVRIILDIQIETQFEVLYIRGQILRNGSRLEAPMQQTVHKWCLGHVTGGLQGSRY